MKRGMRTLQFAATVAALWLTGAAQWPVSALIDLLGDAGCC